MFVVDVQFLPEARRLKAKLQAYSHKNLFYPLVVFSSVGLKILRITFYASLIQHHHRLRRHLILGLNGDEMQAAEAIVAGLVFAVPRLHLRAVCHRLVLGEHAHEASGGVVNFDGHVGFFAQLKRDSGLRIEPAAAWRETNISLNSTAKIIDTEKA